MAQAGRSSADDLEVTLSRATRSILLVALGSVLTTLALVLSLLAWSAAVGGLASTTATPWVVTLLVCSVVLGLLCLVQGRLWQRAVRLWGAGAATAGIERLSWWVHVASYPVVVVAIFSGVAASLAVGLAGAVATYATLALVPLVAAQALAAVQVVRRHGPAGTIPTHARALAARVERSRHED